MKTYKADAVEVGRGEARLGKGLSDETRDVLLVVLCRVVGLETVARRCDVRVSDVGEDDGATCRWMCNDADTELVGRPFEAECNLCP